MTITIKWLGHASFKIDANGIVIYTDPYKGDYSEKADLILVSHSHSDHCDPSKIAEASKTGTVIIAPEDCASKIEGRITTLKPQQETTFNNVKISAVEAYNIKRFRSPGVPFHPKNLGVGYLIKVEGKTIYHAGDTDFIPEMKDLGHIDVALLPSGGTYTMDNVDAAEAATAINPVTVIPMHRWDTDPEEFKKNVEANSNIRIILLREDEEYPVA